MAAGHQSAGEFNIMAKLNTAKGKLVRKFGENIFGNPKYDRLLNRKPYSPGQHGQSRRGTKTKDTYSLNGFAKAFNKINDYCS